MALKKQALCLSIVSAAISVISLGQFASAQFSISSGQSCNSIGQIRDYQGQRFICRRVNAKAGSSSGPYLIWFKISSPKTTTKPTTTTQVAITTSTSSTTSTNPFTKKKLLSATYEVLDASRIKISWNFIASVREYRICVGGLCSGPNPQWLTIGPTENSKILDLPLGQSQSYWVHALLLNDAKEYDSIDTRPCCIGTKWADGVTVSAKNNFGS